MKGHGYANDNDIARRRVRTGKTLYRDWRSVRYWKKIGISKDKIFEYLNATDSIDYGDEGISSYKMVDDTDIKLRQHSTDDALLSSIGDMPDVAVLEPKYKARDWDRIRKRDKEWEKDRVR